MSETPPLSPRPVGRLRFRIELLLAALLGAMHLRYAWIVSQPPPHQDDWAILAGLFEAQEVGNLPPWFFTLHNGHILVAARLAFWGALHFTGLDLAWIRWLCTLISWLGVGLWFRWLRRNLVGEQSPPGLFLGGALVIFSLCYWEYFSIAIGFSAYLAALFASAGFALLARAFRAEGRRFGTWLAAGGCFLLALLTFGSGYAAVAAALGWLLFMKLRRKFAGGATWPAAVCQIPPIALGFVLFFSQPMLRPANLFLFNFAYRFCLCVGAFAPQALPDSSLSLREMLAFGTGLLLFCAAVWQLLLFFRHGNEEPGSLWGSGLLMWGVCACLAVAYSRLSLPPEEMLSSRYSLHFAAGLIGLMLCLRQQRWIFSGYLSALAVVTLLACRNEWRIAPYRRDNYEHMVVLMKRLPEISDLEVQREFYWSGTAQIRRVTLEMERAHLGVFRPVTNP